MKSKDNGIEVPDQNSATESNEEYEIPKCVNDRISDWFNRNDQATSRQSEVADTNLEDIRQIARNRIAEKTHVSSKKKIYVFF